MDAFGFGKFQVKLSLFTGLCWMADSMETTILSILSPTLHYEWQITRLQQALATTVSLLLMFRYSAMNFLCILLILDCFSGDDDKFTILGFFQ